MYGSMAWSLSLSRYKNRILQSGLVVKVPLQSDVPLNWVMAGFPLIITLPIYWILQADMRMVRHN